ncbi:hypothetical protein ABIC73_004302 [Prescottella equi]
MTTASSATTSITNVSLTNVAGAPPISLWGPAVRGLHTRRPANCMAL